MQKRTQEILKHVHALYGELRSADTKMDETHWALHLPCRAAAAGRREGHFAKNGHWRLAAEPILISHYAGQMDMRRAATTVQLLTAGVLAIAFMRWPAGRCRRFPGSGWRLRCACASSVSRSSSSSLALIALSQTALPPRSSFTRACELLALAVRLGHYRTGQRPSRCRRARIVQCSSRPSFRTCSCLSRRTCLAQGGTCKRSLNRTCGIVLKSAAGKRGDSR